MLNAMISAGMTLLLSTTGAIGGNSASTCPDTYNPVAAVANRTQISFARAFVGGQDVVQITRADARKVPFMDVRAADLLISYVYDKSGKLIDRKVWYADSIQSAKRSML